MKSTLVQRSVHSRNGCGGAFRKTSLLRCPFGPNLTSLTNQHNKNEYYKKFGKDSKPMGIPRIDRRSVRPITVLHETPHLLVAGRNYANGFSSNQFLLIQREKKECIFVDASDDWPDDWVTFIASSGLTPTHVFLTHCHIDNVINLHALLSIMEQHFNTRMGIMWCPAEQTWADAYPRACQRYGRSEECQRPLPLLQHNLYSHFTYVHQLKDQQRALEEQQRDAAGRGRKPGGEVPVLPPQLVRRKDILLSSATSRSSSFYEFGPHSLLHYLFTPGHSPGHMMLSLPREKLLFTGDVLYYNGVGRVDLPWACGDRLAESLLSLEDFPDNTVLLPGHGRLTTLGRERRENRALQHLYERREGGMQQVSVGFNSGYL